MIAVDNGGSGLRPCMDAGLMKDSAGVAAQKRRSLRRANTANYEAHTHHLTPLLLDRAYQYKSGHVCIDLSMFTVYSPPVSS